ncbi:MAG: YbhB/YbcL family Raf kinase inhibitor-like protein [Nevskia sp.]|nr:YbhB/YbcL family Raf kinase inhibitor-like protein [Nevskia sp.]
MKLASRSFPHGGVIPGRCAFAIKAPVGHLALSRNLNPELHWSGVPAGTRSLVLLCVDGDAPSPKPAHVNVAGTVLPARLPRGEFVHWVMVDIPAGDTAIGEGACSSGITARGKRDPGGPAGSRQGINDYTGWFAGDKDMEGPYFGYDGPCPPWNDSVPHHYRFELHAVDLERCPVEGQFTAAQVRAALAGHVLASAAITGRYALNPLIRLR